jgi:hypothetical protein
MLLIIAGVLLAGGAGAFTSDRLQHLRRTEVHPRRSSSRRYRRSTLWARSAPASRSDSSSAWGCGCSSQAPGTQCTAGPTPARHVA